MSSTEKENESQFELEIQRALRQSSTTELLYKQLVSSLIDKSGAHAGIVWNCTAQPFRQICQAVSKEQFDSTSGSGAQGYAGLRLPLSEQQHLELISKTIEQGAPVFVEPKNGAATQNGHDQPSLMFGPIRRGNENELIELVFQDGIRDPAQKQLVLKRLNDCCAAASQFQPKENLEAPSQDVEQSFDNLAPANSLGAAVRTEGIRREEKGGLSLSAVDQYVHSVHQSIDYKITAANIANEGRNLVDCDRVTVATLERGVFQIQAISGQPSVNRRSNTVLALRDVIRFVLKTGQSFWYPAEGELSPQIEQALNNYLSNSATRSISIEPVFEKLDSEDPLENGPRRNRVIGGIVAESCQEEVSADSLAPRIRTLSRHGGDALRNALRHLQLFLYPLWNLLGKSKILMAARNMPKTIAVTACVLLAIALLIFVPAPMNVVCEGEVLPVKRDRLYAESEGTIEQIFVTPGQDIRKGQKLIQLSNPNLQLQLQEKMGEKKRIEAARNTAQMVRMKDPRGERGGEQTENTEALQAQIESLDREIDKINDLMEQMVVTSRIDGQVITWDFVEKLKERPVTFGDQLLEVADVDGQWQLELQLPDKKISHVKRAQARLGEELKVDFVLASNPGVTYTGTIKSIARATQLQPDQKQSVRVVVELDAKDLDLRHVRARVNARIRCGQKSIGYVWLHPVGEFLQSQVLFRIW